MNVNAKMSQVDLNKSIIQSHFEAYRNKIINYSGMSIYRLQNGKMAEMWHVIQGWPLEILF